MIEFECGDARELIREQEDGSVDLFLLDPPYAKRDAYLIDELAPEFRRVLKNDGHLILYAGNYCVPDWTRGLDDAGLRYRALMWLQHTGRCQVRPELKMRMDGKPMLVYSRIWRTYPQKTLSNVIEGGGRDKRYHEWGQDVESAMHVIEHYTKPGDLVLDTFAGAGTVLLAAWRLGRRAKGFEIDPRRYETACERIDKEVETDAA